MEEIRNFLRTNLIGTLPRHGHKAADALAQQLHSIERGLKTGFIWDFACFSAAQANDLLTKLKEAKLVKNSLLAFQIGEDFGFLDGSRIDEIKFGNFAFIEISKHLNCPVVVEKSSQNSQTIQQTLNSIHAQIQHSIPNEILTLVFDSTVHCIPTVFGLLIGYPVVYWFDVAQSDQNCLSGVPLTVFQVGWRPQSGPNITTPAVSFSVPCSVLEIVQNSVDLWKQKVADSELHFTSFSKTLDTVVL
uniref:UPF0739 protein C1orf74 n=1 Tax=Culex pipiens TaxID=7175 RepID=A0A8D8H0I2_CULPI